MCYDIKILHETAQKRARRKNEPELMSILEKAAFREPAKTKRCLIYVDGFYEHHHFNGNAYPYFIQSEYVEPLCLGGLWDEWINPETGEIYRGFSIVTTKANSQMEKIHNNPKLKEARMPLILKQEDEDFWLNQEINSNEIKQLLIKESKIELKAHTVHRLRGKSSLGNVPEVSLEHNYPELSQSQLLDL